MFGGVPGPAVSNGERATDGGGESVDVAVGIAVVDFRFAGFLEDLGSGSEVALFEVKNAGAEFKFFVAIVVDDVNDGMRNSEVFELIESIGKDDFVSFFIGGEDGGAKVGHFDMIETKKGSGNKK